MILLQAKLLAVLEEQRVAAVSEIRGDMVKAEWGQQIRNYVFHPYKMVKVASWWLATLASQVDTATKGRYRSSDTIVCRVGHTQDLRTGEETSDIESVMDGKLNAFVEAMLHHRTSPDVAERLPL
jgi:peptide chain release factor 2